MRDFGMKLLATLSAACVLGGCSSTSPLNYERLDSLTQLVPNSHDREGREPFTYVVVEPQWHRYRSVILDPVSIYHGPDQQFGRTSNAEKDEIAAYMSTEFSAAIQNRYSLVQVASPSTLRIRATLTGIETNTPVLSPISKLIPAGFAVNTFQTLRSKQGPLTGSVSFAVEVYESESNRLLLAYVAKQYPSAVNVFASFGALDASKAGVRSGAEELVSKIR